MPKNPRMALQDALAERDGNAIKIYWTGEEWCAEVNTTDRDGFQHLADAPAKALALAIAQVRDDVAL